MFLKNRNIISKMRRSKVTDYAALKERIRSLWSKFFPLREVPIWKGTQLKRVIAWSISLPLICVTFSAFWLRRCKHYHIHIPVWSEFWSVYSVRFSNTRYSEMLSMLLWLSCTLLVGLDNGNVAHNIKPDICFVPKAKWPKIWIRVK